MAYTIPQKMKKHEKPADAADDTGECRTCGGFHYYDGSVKRPSYDGHRTLSLSVPEKRVFCYCGALIIWRHPIPLKQVYAAVKFFLAVQNEPKLKGFSLREHKTGKNTF